jgi:hypothetical protein
MYNLFFYYKNYNRYILFLKHSKNKYHFINLLRFEKMSIFFNIKDLTDLNSYPILSSLFFFKYYFGVTPYFTKYKHVFKLNVNYFNFTLEYNFVGKFIYAPLFYFINDIYYMINKAYLICTKSLNYWEYHVTDMNFFVEKKNTLGFFNLKHHLFIKLYYKNPYNWNLNLFDTFKLKN